MILQLKDFIKCWDRATKPNITDSIHFYSAFSSALIKFLLCEKPAFTRRITDTCWGRLPSNPALPGPEHARVCVRVFVGSHPLSVKQQTRTCLPQPADTVVRQLHPPLSPFAFQEQLPGGRWGWAPSTQRSQTQPVQWESWGRWAALGWAVGLRRATTCWGLSERPWAAGWGPRPEARPAPASPRAAHPASTASASAKHRKHGGRRYGGGGRSGEWECFCVYARKPLKLKQ